MKDFSCYFFFLFLIYFFIVVQVQLSAFPPTTPPPAQPSSPPSRDSTPLGFVHMSYFIVVPKNPSPFSPIILSYLPSGYCLFVLYFNVSGYILLACFFDYVPVKGEIIWYLSFTAWLISPSIMLSSSIHAVVKGRNSFFPSAA